jgi:hypothetical protein
MTEIEKVKGEIKVLQAKLSLLEEIEKYKTPVEESYKNAYGYYPPTTPSVSNFEDTRWRAFELGYNASKNNSEDISKVLIEGDDAYIMGVKYRRVEEPYCPDDPPDYDEVEWDEKDNPKPMNEVMDRLENKYKQAEDKQKPKTIRSIIDRWWMDTFTTHSEWDGEECMDDLADQIEFFYMRNKK